MKRRLSHPPVAIAFLTLLAALTACGGGGGSSPIINNTTVSSSWTWSDGTYFAASLGSNGPTGVSNVPFDPAAAQAPTGLINVTAGQTPSDASNGFMGMRQAAIGWTDLQGDLWLFGGIGFDASGNPGQLGDLWKYVSSTGAWRQVGGQSTANSPGVYGTLGVAASSNVPGSREAGTAWTDSAGNLWLFGGVGIDSDGTYGQLNDLWKYNPGTGQWTWIGGSNTIAAPGVYGTRGTPSAGDIPGARGAANGWTDSAGNLWLFGGLGFDSTGALGFLNDLWKYSTATGQWTWISGANTNGAQGTYGTLGAAAAGNVPGARTGSVSQIDGSGNLWLYSGNGLDSTGQLGELNDLWEYAPSIGQWTWIGGSNTANPSGVYGTVGTAAANNVPGGRNDAVSWITAAGNFVLLGGYGLDSTGTFGNLNDLWQYNFKSGQWAWIGGANTVDAVGVYGQQNVASPTNVPGARSLALAWNNPNGTLYLLGGVGIDSDGNTGYLNDFWKLSVSQ